MLRSPTTDPNALWSEITDHYLHIIPHPEFSWWALRVQLVHMPGYMVNYGLGAVLTADMRQHIRESLGPFETGEVGWYSWFSEKMLRYGSEQQSHTLLRDFLGRPVSPEALLKEIHRLAPAPTPN
jgi:Zn-dependent M32 family carboxypeptidase